MVKRGGHDIVLGDCKAQRGERDPGEVCAHQGSGPWAVGAWRTSGHCCLEWGGKDKAARALPGPRGEGVAGGLGHWGGGTLTPGAGRRPLGTTSAAPGRRSHASLLCCRHHTSMPPSGNSLVSVSELTLTWWVILHPFSQPQTFHFTQVRGVRSTHVASTPAPPPPTPPSGQVWQTEHPNSRWSELGQSPPPISIPCGRF